MQAVKACKVHRAWTAAELSQALIIFLHAYQRLASRPEADIRKTCTAGFVVVLEAVTKDM